MNRKSFLIIWSVLRAGLLIGTFADLPLSLRLFDRNNIIAKGIDEFAMAPSMLLVELSCCVYSWYNHKDRMRFIVGIMLTELMGFLCVNEINSRFGMDMALVIGLGTLLALASLVLVVKRRPDISETQYVTVVNIMQSALLIFVITSGLKTIWGRMRFYVMEDPVRQFTGWYVMKPWGISDSFRSFPSGHSSFSVMMFYLALMLKMQKVKHSRIAAAVTVIWTAAVMWGRITYGAHFLTDTCAGALIGTICVYCGMHNIYKFINIKEL